MRGAKSDIPSGLGRHEVQLACQETPVPAKHVEEMIAHRPHAWDLRKVTADHKPHVALGQALSRQDLHEALIIGCYVSREQRDAVARACRGSLRRLACWCEMKTVSRQIGGQATRLRQ
jgi:hypothetical protein